MTKRGSPMSSWRYAAKSRKKFSPAGPCATLLTKTASTASTPHVTDMRMRMRAIRSTARRPWIPKELKIRLTRSPSKREKATRVGDGGRCPPFGRRASSSVTAPSDGSGRRRRRGSGFHRWRIERRLPRSLEAVPGEADEVVTEHGQVDHLVDLFSPKRRPCHPPERAPIVAANPHPPDHAAEDREAPEPLGRHERADASSEERIRVLKRPERLSVARIDAEYPSSA